MTHLNLDCDMPESLQLDIARIMQTILAEFSRLRPDIAFVDQVFLTICFCTGDQMRSINHKYRNVNSRTDVVSLGYLNDIHSADSIEFLGEIFIDLEYVKKDFHDAEYIASLKLGCIESFSKYLVLILVHGFLHLLGYDHIKEQDAKIMNAIQQKIWNRAILFL